MSDDVVAEGLALDDEGHARDVEGQACLTIMPVHTGVRSDTGSADSSSMCCQCNTNCWFACACPCHDDQADKKLSRQRQQESGTGSSVFLAGGEIVFHTHKGDAHSNSVRTTTEATGQCRGELEKGGSGQSDAGKLQVTPPAVTRSHDTAGRGGEVPKRHFGAAGARVGPTIDITKRGKKNDEEAHGGNKGGMRQPDRSSSATPAADQDTGRSRSIALDSQRAYLATSESRGPRTIHFGSAPRFVTVGSVRTASETSGDIRPTDGYNVL